MAGDNVPANSGRDRAIETLIDNESHGPFYRAARVLDEAVPFALSNRPNLVTRSALVEQANSLAENEIDTTAKFDREFPPCPISHVQEERSPEEKERILRHHSKIIKIQRVWSGQATMAASPPPQLVAALRRLYKKSSDDDGDASRGALLRSLLRDVMNHEVFSRKEEDAKEKEGGDETAVSSDSQPGNESGSDVDTEVHAANLESIVGNVCRLMSENETSLGTEDNREVLRGLLVALLSILTGSNMTNEDQVEPEHEGSLKTKIVDGQKRATTSPKSRPDSLKLNRSSLQVGGVLSLLPLVSIADDETREFGLDSEILSYLGKSASVYEERIEIQKSRVLAELKAKSEKEEAAKKADESADTSGMPDLDGDPDLPLAPVTPPSANASNRGATAGDVVSRNDVAIVESEETEAGGVDREQAVDAPADEVAADLGRAGEIGARVSDDDESDDGIPPLREPMHDESSDDDSAHSDEEHDSDLSDGFDGENPQSALDTVDAPDIDIEDDDDSSSSSSSDDDDDDDEVIDDDDDDAMLVDDVDSDGEEDDVMLRQALALSLVDHPAAGSGGSARGNQEVDVDESNQVSESKDEEDSKPPPLESPSSIELSESKDTACSADVEDVDSTLPPLPAPPAHYPYKSLLTSLDDESDSGPLSTDQENAQEGDVSSEASYMEPSALAKFGTLPSSHVVFHLLLNVIGLVQGPTPLVNAEEKQSEKKEKKTPHAANSVPGGIGNALFTPSPLSYNMVDSHLDVSAVDDVSFQLLVAAFLLVSESRGCAIENLRQAILTEHQNAGESDNDELKEDEDGSSTPTSDEEDDPAVALAMNYAYASPSTSEAFERKGMKRKAAAAARDAALLRKTLRKRTDGWKQRVQFYSYCSLMLMKCLEVFLRSTTRRWLSIRSQTEIIMDSPSVSSLVDFLPPSILESLSNCLSELMSGNKIEAFRTLVAEKEAAEVEHLLMSTKLYQESVVIWAEIVPLLYPTSSSRAELLLSLIQETYSQADLPLSEGFSLNSLTAFPTTKLQTFWHRLRILCPRLRTTDLLDGFISHPVSYDPEDSVEAHEIVKLRDEGGKTSLDDPERASTLIAAIGATCRKIKAGDSKELHMLYLALCHKCNVRTLFWDGFLAFSGDGSDDSLSASPSGPALGYNGILGVSANPSNSLQFDASKCSDSIAILSTSSSTNGSSAHQRASKVWGTVLSSSYFSPKTGIHRWALRLDRCERGHVFVGVATSQASMRTYVGGDKYGWGVIGTQALWHDRRKIRGDYGATFRTGSTIVVTLDTDAGTLSFSSWKDSNTSAAFSLDALLPSLGTHSPGRRNSAGGGGIVEDWGVAFEGLPLDSRLYPAVGLYQRDDRVTLLPVESGGRSSLKQGGAEGWINGAACYYPRNLESVGGGIDGVSHHRRIVHARRHNDLLTWDGVQYVTDVLRQAVQSRWNENDILFTSVLPSIAASLCLVPPSIPVLSARSALALLPQLSTCIRVLDGQLSPQKNDAFFCGPLAEGEWIIRATGSNGTLSASEDEEYVVKLSVSLDAEKSCIGFQGTGVGTTGKSKNGHVSIVGATQGSAISFTEEWTDGNAGSLLPEDNSSSCVIAARMSLDGRKFEGSYRNVQFGTTGHISGMLLPGDSKTPGSSSGSNSMDPLLLCESLLSLAHGHLSTIIGCDAAGDHMESMDTDRNEKTKTSSTKQKVRALKKLLAGPLLCQGRQSNSASTVDSLREFYSFPLHGGASVARGDYRALDTLDSMLSSVQVKQHSVRDTPDLASAISVVDDEYCFGAGGNGSLSGLCPADYVLARQRIICAMLHHCQLHDNILRLAQTHRRSPDDGMIAIWRAALKIMENGTRRALAGPEAKNLRRKEVAIKHCQMINSLSSFLLRSSSNHRALSVATVIDQVVSFFETVTDTADLNYLEKEMDLASSRAFLRLAAFQQMNSLFHDRGKGAIQASVALECAMVSLPRLLGRGQAEGLAAVPSSQEDDESTKLTSDELGGHYLTNLSGAGSACRSIVDSVLVLFRSLGSLVQAATSEEMSTPSSTSLLLTFLATFTTTLLKTDVGSVVVASGILQSLKQIMSCHRDSAFSKDPETETVIEKDKIAVVRAICDTKDRDNSRAVVQASLSVAHVIAFQLVRTGELSSVKTPHYGSEARDEALRAFIDFLFSEWEETIFLTEKVMRDQLSAYQIRNADEDFGKWCETCLQIEAMGSKSSKDDSKLANNRSGLFYLMKNGTLQSMSITSPSQQKLSSRASTTSSNRVARTETILAQLGTPLHQQISQLLNILSGMVKYRSSQHILASWDLIAVLLQSVGLKLQVSSSIGSLVDYELMSRKSIWLPVRYRTRIMRLLFPLLSELEPNEIAVKSLFELVGFLTSAVAVSVFEDENAVAFELVSLLRRLYSFVDDPWRLCIHRAIEQVMVSSSEHGEMPALEIGVLAFLSGSIGRISPLSHVLLKPAAAAPLAPDLFTSSSGKSHGSSSGSGSSSGIGVSPHHVLGNGTEGVVAGLCRLDACAGIVSSVDTKNGHCEVILTTRSSDRRKPSQAPLRARSNNSSEKRLSNARYTMTVRALRAPLADVANAEEAPLVLGSAFPVEAFFTRVVPSALNSLLAAQSSVAQSAVDVVRLSHSVMTIRSLITLLSDTRLLSNFMKMPGTRKTLSGLMKLAACELKEVGSSSPKESDSTQMKGLSALPVYEAKYCHLLSLLAELNFRMESLQTTPKTYWKTRMTERVSKKKAEDEKTRDQKSEDVAGDGYSTPTTTTGSSTRPAHPFSSSTSTRTRDSGSRARSGISSMMQGLARSSRRSNDNDDEEDLDDTAASHLREAAIAQMAELGLPRPWSELALRRTGGTNIEAAVHFCLERGGDMDRLLAEERERERMMQRQSSGSGSSRRRSGRSETNSSHLLRQLLEMGFPSRWCAEALAATRNNVDEALTWILTNGERLSAEDEGIDEDEDDGESESGDDDSGDEANVDTSTESAAQAVLSTADMPKTQQSNDRSTVDTAKEESLPESESTQRMWSGSVTPLRFISGRSIINPATLEISGLPSGGFSSVGTKGVMLTSGKWYYEAILESAGCLQIGWADGSFSGHCNADRGDGCGDGPSSWAYDGWRRYRWHACATEWGCRWKEGDVVGCMVDMDNHVVSFTLNGRGEEIGMGVAFTGQGFRPCGGVYACVSFNRREKLRLILGGNGSESFKHQPPDGYRGVGEAVLESVQGLDLLLKNETILDDAAMSDGEDESPDKRKFLCDFSDGEHGHELFSWQHRYHGSDASVHLGSGRSSKLSGASKQSGSSNNADSSAAKCVSKRVETLWSKLKLDAKNYNATDDESSFVVSKVEEGYKELFSDICNQISDEIVKLGILYSRKLILHTIVTLGSRFSLNDFLSSNFMDGELEVARQLWKVLDVCVSLRTSGWVGEAGAMAVAAEALGLGITSNDHGNIRHHSGSRGSASSNESFDDVALASGGISQLLSSTLVGGVLDDDLKNTSLSFAGCAEAAIGGAGGGGSLIFLRKGLQSAACKSESLRKILVAVIRRSVRLLALVDYTGNDALDPDAIEDDDAELSGFDKTRSKDSTDEDNMLPDARLACFFTGMLLSAQVQRSLTDPKTVLVPLFESWSVGLLSASSPWRMVCALTSSAILHECPEALADTMKRIPAMREFYSRLESTVVRRIWAERAAAPVCSRFVQGMIELMASVKRAVQWTSPLSHSPMMKGTSCVDASTPIPYNVLELSATDSSGLPISWEWEEFWIASDAGWEVWSGTVDCMAVDWKTPSRSAVRTLMDAGEGPPMLREGCHVMRGLDWDEAGSGSETGNEDGKDQYEKEKSKREKEKIAAKEQAERDNPAVGPTDESEAEADTKSGPEDPACESPSREQPHDQPEAKTEQAETKTASIDDGSKKKKVKKTPSPKLPIGTVLSIEPWKGLPAMARRVRWHRTGIEGIYRYGGDGGRYDIIHVEVNEKSTRVRKRHPLPESAEQCAARHGFGAARKYNVLLRVRRHPYKKIIEDGVDYFHEGILEWPDFGAAVKVDCTLHSDGAVTIVEKDLLFGSKDSGWEARFGHPSYKSGTVMVLSPTGSSKPANQADLDARSAYQSFYEDLLGSSCFTVENLRNPEDGSKLRLTSEMKLSRAMNSDSNRGEPLSSIEGPLPPPIHFDKDYKASSLSLSLDGRTVTCVSPDGRATVFGSVGFTKGVHYWEVKLEQADIGSVFIGVAEKPTGGSTTGFDMHPRLNRWHGWGFVNFRATYTSGAERVYGAHCHNTDTVGVLLDCDAGRLSFFCDQLKYGEHILNDLGCAFENLSPFGFNADGCGSGGAGHGAPSGVEGGRGGRYPAQGSVRPRALWPVVGLRTPGDRATISSKWMSSYGIDGTTVLKNVLAVDEILCRYDESDPTKVGSHLKDTTTRTPQVESRGSSQSADLLPGWFIEEAFQEYRRWHDGRWHRSRTRGSGPNHLAAFGLDVDLDTSPLACASASAAIGCRHALLSGDRVFVKRSAGRFLELAEEAVVLGAYQGRLFYQIVAQKSEGGSLTEGGGRAWFWDESEVVDNALQLMGNAKGLGVELPLLDRFKCTSAGGLKIVYEGGAVIRSDLEILDGSQTIGSIPVGTIIPQKDVLERRVNSCGVVRYKILFEPVGKGWISSRIRGGKEEPIVAPIHSEEGAPSTPITRFRCPHDSAIVWNRNYLKALKSDGKSKEASSLWEVKDARDFRRLIREGLIHGVAEKRSDEILATAISAIADFSKGGDAVDCAFEEVVGALSFAVASHREGKYKQTGTPGANEAAAAVFSSLDVKLPSIKALLARVAVLRAFNRRARFALPWMSARPSQEGSAILGGLSGHGASIERAGRSINVSATNSWFQASSIASRVRSNRSILFFSVKRLLLDSITEATKTPTPLSHDEYELPREIRTVRINRLKALRAMAGDDNASKRKWSIFSQLMHETRSWGGAALRRGFVAKGHGGQKRAFKVKLIGEGVNDYSGPYREAFTDAAYEISQLDSRGRGALAVLDPTPNNASEIGDNRDLFMFYMGNSALVTRKVSADSVSPAEREIWQQFATLTFPRDESSREIEESLFSLGRMAGTACRHGIPVDLNLPLTTVWKALTEESSDSAERLMELDLLAYRQQEESGDDTMPPILWWQQRMLNSFVEGLSNVLPVEIFPIFSGHEVRDIICGNPEVDVELLRRVVEYEGYDESDRVIGFFWECLREMDENERKKFLQFVWARSRLPMKESDFDAPFKIQRDMTNIGVDADAALPSASTCFFSLSLPDYSSKSVLQEKLLFAIDNVCTMESDYVTNDAEVGEGWRGL